MAPAYGTISGVSFEKIEAPSPSFLKAAFVLGGAKDGGSQLSTRGHQKGFQEIDGLRFLVLVVIPMGRVEGQVTIDA